MILITNFGPYGAVKGLTNLQDTRGSMASIHLRANLLAIFMIFIMIFSSFSLFLLNNYELEKKSDNSKMTLIGDSEIVEISTFPNGFSEDFSLIIPEDDALDALEFDLEPIVDISTDEHSWSTQSDWTNFRTESENVDYNLTGLRMNLPPSSWDFESFNHGWSLDAAGGWAWGVDSAGAHSGSKAIYTYSGQYPNQMATTYYATSPSIDCSSCSGGWNVNFWKQLGVESSSWDHAYFQVKGINGWHTIWENSGSVSDVSYSLQSYRVDSYISGNSDFKIRFGLGPTDFSVTYDGWNIDDVSITPVSGSGTGAAKVEGSGDANWTSPIIGYGQYHSVRKGPFGLLNILAETPENTGIDWTILDAQTNNPILGYEAREELFADLGRIDWLTHPNIRIKLHLWSDEPISPIIHSISLGNTWNNQFFQNPNDMGWNSQGNWVDEKYEGSGSIEFPEIFSTRPIVSLTTDIDVSGTGQLQVSDGFGIWNNISTSGNFELEKPTKNVLLRWLSNSGSWSFKSLIIEFENGLLPLSPIIDIRNDGESEWNLSRNEIGFWGSQDRWIDGSLSQLVTLSTGTPKYIDFWIPSNSVFGLCLDLNPELGEIIELDAEIRLGSSIISEFEIRNNFGIYRICLNETNVNSLNENITQNGEIWNAKGQGFVLGKLKLTGINQRVLISSLDISYQPKIEFREYSDSNIISTINDFLALSSPNNGYYEVPIPIYSSVKSSYLVNLIDQHSTSGLLTKDTMLVNSTQPLVSSEKWLEIESKHLVTFGNIEYIEYQFNSDLYKIDFSFPVNGDPFIMSGDYDLIELSETPFLYSETSENISKLRFRINPNWDDDYNLEIRVRLVRDDGIKSMPDIILVGSENIKSVENDVMVDSWLIRNDLGVKIPETLPFLKSGSDVSIEVNLGFEGINTALNTPKSGDLEVLVLENGFEIGRSSNFSNGKVIFVRSIPFGPGNLTYEIMINPLFNQEDKTDIIVNRTFTADSLAPQLISSTVERYDHRSPSTNQILGFDIFDRPVLPDTLQINLWREWIDDFNQDGQPSPEEYWSNTMFSPANLSASEGRYTYVLDDSNAPLGSFVYGFITGSDSAGNMLVGGGGPTLGEELFVYQVKSDGSPQILSGDISWNNSGVMWLNPDVSYELTLPFNEPNGISDIDSITFDLADFSETDGMRISWNRSASGCTSNGNILIVLSCNVYSRNSFFGPFNSELEFRINFKIKWSYVVEESFIHEPSIEIKERSGYSSIMTLPQLRWRFSNEIWIDSDNLEITSSVGSKIDNSVYVLPDTLLQISGSLSYSRTGIIVSTTTNVEMGIGFNKESNSTDEGIFYFEINSPLMPGNYPLSIDLPDLNLGIFDSGNMATTWVVVDNQAPELEQINSPRPDSVFDREQINELVIELSIKETTKLLHDSVIIHWSISPENELPQNYIFKESIELLDIVDPIAGRYSLSILIPLFDKIDELPIDQELRLNIWIEGSDAAGNQIETEENSELYPLASWTILPYQPELVITDITYSKYGGIKIGDPLKVVITLKNEGNSDANTNITVLVRNAKGEFIIAQEPIVVTINSKSSIALDWAPDTIGSQWIEVRWNNEYLGEGSLVSVTEQETTLFSSFESTGTIFIGVFILLAIVISLLFVFYNSDDEYYEEFEDYYEEEESPEKKVELIEMPPLPPPPKNTQELVQVKEVIKPKIKENNVKQWTDEKGYTWRMEGDNTPKWWDGTSWKDV